MRAAIHSLLLSIVFAGICATGAAASSLFPLEAGRIWEFADGARRVVIEADQEGTAGTTEESDLAGITRRWKWRTTPAGAVEMLGFEADGHAYTYDPPLAWLPDTPVKGDAWSNRSSILNEGGKPVGEIVQHWSCAGWETLDFAWGSVQALRMELTGDHPGIGYAGREEVDPGERVWVHYYADGLGIVRRGENGSVLVDVEGFGTGFVATVPKSMGALKARH